MLCLPALTPVANDAHAVGDSGECVVCSGENPPRFASAEMFGSLPSAIHFSSRCGSIPSKPRMTIFCVNFEAGRGLVPEQAIEVAAIAAAAIASKLTDLRMGTCELYPRAAGGREQVAVGSRTEGAESRVGSRGQSREQGAVMSDLGEREPASC